MFDTVTKTNKSMLFYKNKAAVFSVKESILKNLNGISWLIFNFNKLI